MGVLFQHASVIVSKQVCMVFGQIIGRMRHNCSAGLHLVIQHGYCASHFQPSLTTNKHPKLEGGQFCLMRLRELEAVVPLCK